VRRSVILCMVGVVCLGSAIRAGPYSASADDPGKIDSGIPGFVGPAGQGVVDPSNYVNPAFVAWASGYLNYQPANFVDPIWAHPTQALGPVSGDNTQVVSLGELNAEQIAAGAQPGRITMTFVMSIGNGTGTDFAVFENGHIRGAGFFAELAYVEVSTDNVYFARVPSVSLTPNPVGNYGTIDPTDVYNLAGKHANAYGLSWGTPFDLQCLANDPLVQAGLVDLYFINYVRIVDIPGSGAFLDGAGSPIYDAWPTWGSGGFDLEAVGILNKSPSPGDANNDGAVDIGDLGILAGNWGRTGSTTWGMGDFDRDGSINVGDLGILAGNWDTHAGGEIPLPDPLSAVMLLVGTPVVIRRKIGRNSSCANGANGDSKE